MISSFPFESPLVPWPSWSAQALNELGFPVRDYEVDGHRLTARYHAGFAD